MSVKSETGVKAKTPPAEEGTFQDFTSEEERRLVRRIDLHLMPLLFVSYSFQLLDKTSLAYGAMLGIKKDLNLVGQEYSWSSSIFYVGFLVASYPISIGFVKLPIAKYLSVMIGIWGIILTLHAAACNYAGLMVLRALLGVLESSQSPGFSLITGMWYTPYEQTTRHLIWNIGNCLGEAVGSLISYGILYYDGGFPQWKILFVLLGLLTIVWSIVLWFYLPDSPESAYFLNEKERALASLRPKKYQHTTQTKVWQKDQFIETLLDPKSWWFMIFMFLLMVPSGGVTAFSTIIINGFGFDKYKTVILGLAAVPFQLIAFALMFIFTSVVRRARLYGIIGLYLNSLLGILLVKFLPEEKRWGRVTGFWLVRAYMPMVAMTLGILSSNTAGFTKKSTTGAMLFIGYCVGNMVGPQFFVSTEAPGYTTAYTTMLICFVLTIVFAAGLRVYLVWENKRRDREQEVHIDAEEKRTVDFEVDGRLEELDETDRANKGFRYVV